MLASLVTRWVPPLKMAFCTVECITPSKCKTRPSEHLCAASDKNLLGPTLPKGVAVDVPAMSSVMQKKQGYRGQGDSTQKYMWHAT